MERKPQPADTGLNADQGLVRLSRQVAQANVYRFCQAVEQLYPERPPLGSTARVADDPVRFRPDPGMAFPASELRALELDDQGGAPTVRTRLLGLYGVDSPMPTAWLDDIAQKREGHEALTAFLDMFNHRIFTQFYRIWRKYSYPASFAPGGSDATSQCLLGLIGLGIPGTAKRIATPMSRFLALLGVMRLPTRNAEGVIALVQLLAPKTQAQVTAHWPRRIILQRPASLSSTHPISLGQGMPIGDAGLDVNCQLKLSLFTADLEQAQAWLPGTQRHTDLLVLLRVYLGWRCTASLQLCLPLSCLPAPVLGTAGLLLGMTAVLGAGEAVDQRTVTVNLGQYEGLKNNTKRRESNNAPYRFI